LTEANDQHKDLEEEVFKTLSHQIRRDILRVVGETKGAKFTEIKMAAGIVESASLSYHLSALASLLVHEKDFYRLSELGKDTYSLMNKIVTYSESAVILGTINKKIGSTIIANALMWASAISYLQVVEGPLQFLTLCVFASLFSVSNLILYSITQDTKLR
jgi:DNA-binding transcriptional ArsR family regulator